MGSGRRDSQRVGARRPLRRQSGNGAQGNRRDGCREPPGSSAGQGHFRRTHKDPGSFFVFCAWLPMTAMPQVSQSVPLECWRAKAGADVARTLALEPGAPITILRRLLKLGDEPVVFDEIYLAERAVSRPVAGSPAVGRVALQPVRKSLWRAHDPCRRAPARRAADRVSAELLQVAEGARCCSSSA
jgi:GntR family transcriptional regulator